MPTLDAVRVHELLGFPIKLKRLGKAVSSEETETGRLDPADADLICGDVSWFRETKNHPGEEFQENRIKHSPV